jgi:hypothetical protein
MSFESALFAMTFQFAQVGAAGGMGGMGGMFVG